MKKLLVLILVAMVLGAVVPGCRHVESYDGRLVAADSLMRTNPDSALSLLESLNSPPARGEVARSDGGGGADLATDGDRAYRDLLVTQARYKAYITATSDSDINRALAYFSDHPADREKLTRAYIYKGAVMDELGHPDSAMLYYKTAESTAAPDDYFNLGYAKMRMATLYQDQFSQDPVAINYLKQAIHCYEIIRDTNYLISCYGDLGKFCGIKYPDSTEYYLNHAIHLAQLSNSSEQYTYKSTLAGFYFYHYKDYERAKNLAMEVMHNGSDQSNERQYYYYAALSYVRMGMIDSAKLVLNATPAPIDVVDSMNRHQVMAEIAKAKNDVVSYVSNMTCSKDNQIQIMANSKDNQLKNAETEYLKIKAEQQEVKAKSKYRNLTIALLITSIVVILLVGLVYYLKYIIKTNNQQREEAIKVLTGTITELNEKRKNPSQMQGSVSELLRYRVKALNELFDSLKFKAKDKNGRIRSIIPLSSVINGMSDTYQLLNIELSDTFWERMKRSVDGEYKGIISYIEKNYPNVTEKELHLLCMMCADIPPQIIKLCMNYSNVRSIYSNRSFIMKNKMGLDMTFDEFIDKYIKNEL